MTDIVSYLWTNPDDEEAQIFGHRLICSMSLKRLVLLRTSSSASRQAVRIGILPRSCVGNLAAQLKVIPPPTENCYERRVMSGFISEGECGSKRDWSSAHSHLNLFRTVSGNCQEVFAELPLPSYAFSRPSLIKPTEGVAQTSPGITRASFPFPSPFINESMTSPF